MKITITPKDPKLAKDPAVKKWLREVAKRVEKIMVEQDAPGKMAKAMALDAPLHISSNGKITVLSSFYIPRPENLKVHGYRISSKPMTATEVRERQTAMSKEKTRLCYKNKPRCLICKRLYDDRKKNRGFHTNPKTGLTELCSFADGKIRMGQMVSEALNISPEAWKSLRVAIPVKRSKRSYRGDHYQT